MGVNGWGENTTTRIIYLDSPDPAPIHRSRIQEKLTPHISLLTMNRRATYRIISEMSEINIIRSAAPINPGNTSFFDKELSTTLFLQTTG